MLTVAAESIHPSLWLASQLARGSARTVPTGYPSLDKELPGGGWPLSCLTELLQRQPDRRIALVTPCSRCAREPPCRVSGAAARASSVGTRQLECRARPDSLGRNPEHR